MRRFLLAPALLLLLRPAAADPAPTPSLPSANEIVARMTAADDARVQHLKHYTSLRRYSLDNGRFHVHASMTVKVIYSQGGHKEFQVIDESGPGAIRSRVFKRMLDAEKTGSEGTGREATRISGRNYDFTLTGSREVNGRPCWVLDAAPKTDNALLFRGSVCVDEQDYAVVAIDAAPAQPPSYWLTRTEIKHRYGKFGQFWLPLENDSNSDVRVFGRTTVRIEYSGYNIETN